MQTLDADLAVLYRVSTKVLNQAVRRNIARFPSDFMFRLTAQEARTVMASRSQIVTLKRGQNIKYLPYAFTEQGVAMLSSILRSPRAIEVLARKIEAMEKKYDEQFAVVFDAIKRLIAEESAPKLPKAPHWLHFLNR
jgi:ORF6N domain